MGPRILAAIDVDQNSKKISHPQDLSPQDLTYWVRLTGSSGEVYHLARAGYESCIRQPKVRVGDLVVLDADAVNRERQVNALKVNSLAVMLQGPKNVWTSRGLVWFQDRYFKRKVGPREVLSGMEESLLYRFGEVGAPGSSYESFQGSHGKNGQDPILAIYRTGKVSGPAFEGQVECMREYLWRLQFQILLDGAEARPPSRSISLSPTWRFLQAASFGAFLPSGDPKVASFRISQGPDAAWLDPILPRRQSRSHSVSVPPEALTALFHAPEDCSSEGLEAVVSSSGADEVTHKLQLRLRSLRKLAAQMVAGVSGDLRRMSLRGDVAIVVRARRGDGAVRDVYKKLRAKRTLPLSKEQDPGERESAMIDRLASCLYGEPVNEDSSQKGSPRQSAKHDVGGAAREVKFAMPCNSQEKEAAHPDNWSAEFALRPEQRRSLTWMVSRERDDTSFEVKQVCLFPQMPASDVGELFFQQEKVPSWLLARLGMKEGPLVGADFKRYQGLIGEALNHGGCWGVELEATYTYRVRGGILADKIGYGKTATLLGLIAKQQDWQLPKRDSAADHAGGHPGKKGVSDTESLGHVDIQAPKPGSLLERLLARRNAGEISRNTEEKYPSDTERNKDKLLDVEEGIAEEGEFPDARCFFDMPNTTLILVPTHLVDQWKGEIDKFCKGYLRTK